MGIIAFIILALLAGARAIAKAIRSSLPDGRRETSRYVVGATIVSSGAS